MEIKNDDRLFNALNVGRIVGGQNNQSDKVFMTKKLYSSVLISSSTLDRPSIPNKFWSEMAGIG